jgi:hypothetical protein
MKDVASGLFAFDRIFGVRIPKEWLDEPTKRREGEIKKRLWL